MYKNPHEGSNGKGVGETGVSPFRKAGPTGPPETERCPGSGGAAYWACQGATSRDVRFLMGAPEKLQHP
jgi:hypothetical protein